MERLKAALDKARESRESSGQTVRRAGPLARSAKSAAVQAAWEALGMIEVAPKRIVRRRLVSLAGSSEASAFDVLRTKVLQLTGANGWRRIAITSPLPGSGKTTTTINLAVSLARQQDLRIVVIDLDMRRPAIAKTLGVQGSGNVADMLEGRIAFSDHAVRLGPNLAIAMNFTSVRAPSDLLLRRRSGDVVNEIEQTYQPDLMLFDMPPMLVNDDASAFLGNVDCGLVVAEAGTSTVTQVDTCEKEVAEQTNVLGVVLNKCRFHADGYAYYYNYKYE